MTQLKEGDKVEFEHIGRDLTGTIIEVLADGKVRVKDTRGYMYRYSPENVRPAGTPKQPEPRAQTTDSSNTNTNNQNPNTMAKKKDAPKQKAEPKAKATNETAEATSANPALAEQAKKIAALTCKKHQKIWLLHSRGMDKADVMKYAGCNPGEISNVRKAYGEAPDKVAAAEALLA